MARKKSRTPRKRKPPHQKVLESDRIADQIVKEVAQEIRQRKLRQLITSSAVVAVALIVLGVLTHLLGMGVFGYRLWLYGNNQVFLFNHTTRWVSVSIDGSTPTDVAPLSTEWAPIIGGTSHIVTKDIGSDVSEPPRGSIKACVAGRLGSTPYSVHRCIKTWTSSAKAIRLAVRPFDEPTMLEEFDVFVDGTNLFYHIEIESSVCLVQVDVTDYYRKTKKGKRMRIIRKIYPDETTFPIPETNIILPTKTFPDQLVGDSEKIIWIETVNCALLEEEEYLVIEVLQTRFRDRRERYKEEKELYRQALEREGAW